MSMEGDENTMRSYSHENRMIVRDSPCAAIKKSDRLSLFNLVEDVENARDQLRMLSDEAKHSARRSTGRKSLAIRSPNCSVSTSAHKRQSAKRSSESFSFLSSSPARNSPNRRMTADPADLEAMMKELDDEEQLDSENENSTSVISEMSIHSANESIECESVNSYISTASEAFERLESDRRATCDPADILSMMRDLQEEEESIKGTGCGDRRLTADPADMAAIMRGLEEDERMEKANQQNSICGSDYEEVSGCCAGRESMDTVALVNSVGDMLRELEEAEGIVQGGVSVLQSTASALSSKPNASSASKRRSIAPMDTSLSFSSSVASDSNETIGTMALMANIQSAIDDHGGDDDDTIMTASSFGSIGGLLNIVVQEHVNPRVLGARKAVPTSVQSPRRSSRLSTTEESSSKKYGSAVRDPIASLSTPPKTGPFTSPRKGLRSCLASRTKTVAPVAPAPSSRRNVVFGPPKVAEFNKTSPATNMTPMRKEAAKRMFSMEQKNDSDEEKADPDNSDEWDRLTNTSGGSADQSEDEMSPLPVPGSPAFNKRYYTAEIDSPASIVAEYSSVRRSPRKKPNVSVSSPRTNLNSSIASEATGTVNLPGTLSELMTIVEDAQSKVSSKKPAQTSTVPQVAKPSDVSVGSHFNISCATRDDQTEELELDLHSLIHRHRVDCSAPSDLDDSHEMSNSGSSVLLRGRNASHASESSVPSLGPLLGLSSLAPRGAEVADPVSPSSPMSSVASNESVVSFRECSAKNILPMDISTASNWEANQSQISTAGSVDEDGVTVELEGRLQDLIEEMGSPGPVGKKLKGKKTKKRKPLRSTPSVKSSVEVASPWVGDMSVISTVDDDHTERLEGNLGDLMCGVSSPSNFAMDGNWVEGANTEGTESSWNADVISRHTQHMDVSTASTKSVCSDGMDNSLQSEVVTMQNAPVRVSDISYINLLAAPSADVSVCSMMDRSMDTSVARGSRLSSLEALAMMKRLSALNAGARLNALDQCATPLAVKGSMSIGMKRHSMSVSHNLALSSSKKSRASVSGPFAPFTSQMTSFKRATHRDDLFAVKIAEEATLEMQRVAVQKAADDIEANAALLRIVEMQRIAEEIALAEELKKAEEEMVAQILREEEEKIAEALRVAQLEALEVEERAEMQRRAQLEIQAAEEEARVTAELNFAIAQTMAADEAAHSLALLKSQKSSAAAAVGRAQLRALQIQLKDARRRLDNSADELRSLQCEVSVILESKKDLMISMLEQREAFDKDTALKLDIQRVENEKAEAEAASMMALAEKALNGAKQGVGLLNRLTYCRVLSYQSTCIEIEAVLSPKLRVQVLFNLGMDRISNKLNVDGAHVDLKYVDSSSKIPQGPNSRDWDYESMLANSFFTDIMCCDEVQGPLSESSLCVVTCPADIPPAIQRISGFISTFRRSSTWLECYTSRGWSWAVEGLNVQIRPAGGEYVLTIPVRVVVSGDVRALRKDAIRRTRDGTVVFEAELDEALTAIGQKCPSPFGSFPSGQLKQAIEKFLM